MLVRTQPGHSTDTPTPGANMAASWKAASEIATTPNLLTSYGPMNAGANKPATDAVLTMWPSPCSISKGRKTRRPCSTLHRSTSITRFHSSTSNPATIPPPPTPALLHTTCTAPNAASVSFGQGLDLGTVGHVGDPALDLGHLHRGAPPSPRRVVGCRCRRASPAYLRRRTRGRGPGRCRTLRP